MLQCSCVTTAQFVGIASLPLQELFQFLFSSPRWVVRHASFEGLLKLLRHQGSSGSAIVRLLPDHMRTSSSSTEASPAAVAALKAHLLQQPDDQVRAAGGWCVTVGCLASYRVTMLRMVQNFLKINTRADACCKQTSRVFNQCISPCYAMWHTTNAASTAVHQRTGSLHCKHSTWILQVRCMSRSASYLQTDLAKDDALLDMLVCRRTKCSDAAISSWQQFTTNTWHRVG
jgi:uncharacterized protein YjeT (DUF2065 family)